MLNFKVNSIKNVANLYKEGIDIFSILDNSEEKINYLCNRISDEIGSAVEWHYCNNIAYVKVMEDDVQSAIEVGKNIILKDFYTKNIRYLKDKKLVSLYSEYKCIAVFKIGNLQKIRQWCKLISNTIEVVSYFDESKRLISKEPFTDYKKIIECKDSSGIDFSDFRFFNPMKDFVEKFSHSIRHNLIYNRVIDCTADETNDLIKSIVLEIKYVPVNIDAKKQLELDFLKVLGNFESISNVYYNKRKHRNRWIVIGNVVDNGALLTKIMIIKK